MHKNQQRSSSASQGCIWSPDSKRFPLILTQEGDAGSYSCTAVNSAGRAVRRLSLSIHTLPTFTHLPTDITLSRGERLELLCAAAGSPQPRVSWMANGQLLTGTWAGAEDAERGGE